MPGFMSWVLAPFVLLLSIPLACFAVCTTIFAFWVLYARLVILHFEMAYAIFRSYFIPSEDGRVNLPERTHLDMDPTNSPKRMRRMSNSSGRSVFALNQKKSQSFAGLRGAMPDKDFEGLGGWFLSSSDENEKDKIRLRTALSKIKTQSESMSAGPVRRERPHFTIGGSQQSSGRVSPELVRTPMLSRTPGHRVSGTASPESYFNVPISSSSLSALSTIDRYPRVVDMGHASVEDRRKSRNNSIASLTSVGTAKKRCSS